MMDGPHLELPPPDLAIALAGDLLELRSRYLADALGDAVGQVDAATLDGELREYVPPKILGRLRSRGVAPEIFYALPSLVRVSPRLLAYYRLLLGYSSKLAYSQDGGLKLFATAESRGVLSDAQDKGLPALCGALAVVVTQLLQSVGLDRATASLASELQLMTLGAQLRGGVNNRIGQRAVGRVEELVLSVVRHAVIDTADRLIRLVNAAGREVSIVLGSDPDIKIQEQLSPGVFRTQVSIEIKGGTDRSNIYNRIGEAEKSHLTAKQRDCTEFWTIVNVPSLDHEKAKLKSPTTTRFYHLQLITDASSEQYQDFVTRIRSFTGLAEAVKG